MSSTLHDPSSMNTKSLGAVLQPEIEERRWDFVLHELTVWPSHATRHSLDSWLQSSIFNQIIDSLPCVPNWTTKRV